MQEQPYRPTVRMDYRFKIFVDELFHATRKEFDRNMIIRASLFSAPYSKVFRDAIRPFLKTGVELPYPKWGVYDHGIFLAQEWDGGKMDSRTRQQVLDRNTMGCATGSEGIYVQIGSMGSVRTY